MLSFPRNAFKLLYGFSASITMSINAAVWIFSLGKCALLLYGFAVCFLLLSLYSEISLQLSPPISICSWKNDWPFPSFSSFNLTLCDFWGISKSNGWDSFRSRVEIKCSFKSHFLCFNSPHFNKDPPSHLFPKSLFLSNFTLTLLKSF